MNSHRKQFKKLLGSLVILGTVTTKNCEGLVLLSLPPKVLVPLNWIMVAEEMYVIYSLHVWPLTFLQDKCLQEGKLHKLQQNFLEFKATVTNFCLPSSLSFLCYLKSLLLTICPPVFCNTLITNVIAGNWRWEVCTSVEGEECCVSRNYFFIILSGYCRSLYGVIPEPAHSTSVRRFELLSCTYVYEYMTCIYSKNFLHSVERI